MVSQSVKWVTAFALTPIDQTGGEGARRATLLQRPRYGRWASVNRRQHPGSPVLTSFPGLAEPRTDSHMSSALPLSPPPPKKLIITRHQEWIPLHIKEAELPALGLSPGFADGGSGNRLPSPHPCLVNFHTIRNCGGRMGRQTSSLSSACSPGGFSYQVWPSPRNRCLPTETPAAPSCLQGRPPGPTDPAQATLTSLPPQSASNIPHSIFSPAPGPLAWPRSHLSSR